VAQLGENSRVYRVVVGKLKETGRMKDQVLGKERIALNGSLQTKDWVWNEFICLRIGSILGTW
jgi:hypothetical protein